MAWFIHWKYSRNASGDLKDNSELGLGVPNGSCSPVIIEPKYVLFSAISTKGLNTVGAADLKTKVPGLSTSPPKDIGEKELKAELPKNIVASPSVLCPVEVSAKARPALLNSPKP